jgi:hypothetical protein
MPFTDELATKVTVSPAVRAAAKRVWRQLVLFVVAKLPTGARDDRPFKERLHVLWMALVEEVVVQWERLRNMRGTLGRASRNVARELKARARGFRRGGF